VKLVDFGIAKAATQSHQTRTGLVKGKLAYMAPEQLRAEPLDRRADIFALGVVLYELLAGVKPFDASSEVTLIHAMLYEEMVPLRNRRPHVPPELERIVNRALERDRDHRYPDCRAMHADLEEYLLSTRLAVSALQIAQLVEKHRVAQSRAEGATPSPALATPSRQGPAARTPQPWRAEHTPTEAPTAQLRRPLLRTATDDGGETIPLTQRKMPAAAPPEFIRGTEMAPPPVAAAAVAPSPSQTPRPAPRPHQSPAPAARSWAPVIVGVTGMVALFAGTTAVLWPVKRPQEEQPAPPVQKPVVSEAVAGPPDQPPGPPQGRAQARSVSETPPAPKPPPVRQQVELVVQSDPPAMLKVIAGGKVRASQQGRVITHVLPGPVEIEATGSGQQPFAKRESITLDPLVKRHEHTITVRAGTVQIHSFPPSRVTVDGVYMGDTPRKLRLYEGEHSIQFWCDRTIAACAGGLEATQKIVVEPGKETSVTQWW